MGLFSNAQARREARRAERAERREQRMALRGERMENRGQMFNSLLGTATNIFGGGDDVGDSTSKSTNQDTASTNGTAPPSPGIMGLLMKYWYILVGIVAYFLFFKKGR